MGPMRIDASEFGFDRVKFNLYGLPMEGVSISNFEDLHNAFRTEMFSVTRVFDNTRHYAFRKSEKWSGQAKFNYRKKLHRAYMIVLATVNPSKALRIAGGGERQPKSLDGNLNYPPPDMIENGNFSTWATQSREELASSINGLIDAIDRITTKMVGKNTLNRNGIHVSLEQIELYRDFKVSDAISFLTRIEPLFKAFFREPYKFGYVKNSFSLGSPTRAGEFVKIYAKTSTSIRVEVSFEKKRIQSVLGSNRLVSGWDSTVLAEISKKLLHPTTPELIGFSKLLQPQNVVWDLDRALHAISRRVRCYDIRKEFIEQIAARGSIRWTSEMANLLFRLEKDELIHKAARGVYRIDPDIQQSLKMYLEFIRHLLKK